ncbi:NADP-dependent D-sorbitol-6-phosphate dehydrogenase [Glycine max]|nr:NADP-dependent D-sorbitol-6-phosphate dehydrogenase [Glycine max]
MAITLNNGFKIKMPIIEGKEIRDLILNSIKIEAFCSNYDVLLTRDCLAYSKIKPAVNQIETHPYLQRVLSEARDLCHCTHSTRRCWSKGWMVWYSFMVWPKKYKKTVAQIALRWGIQRNTVVIPKLSKLERLKENFQVFDFELSKEDMELIGSICRKYRTNQPAVFWGIDLYA